MSLVFNDATASCTITDPATGTEVRITLLQGPCILNTADGERTASPGEFLIESTGSWPRIMTAAQLETAFPG